MHPGVRLGLRPGPALQNKEQAQKCYGIMHAAPSLHADPLPGRTALNCIPSLKVFVEVSTPISTAVAASRRICVASAGCWRRNLHLLPPVASFRNLSRAVLSGLWIVEPESDTS